MGNISISGKRIVEKNSGGDSKLPFGTIDLGFKEIYNDLFRFRKVYKKEEGTSAADDLFWALDQPGHYYFKILFYFANPYEDQVNPFNSNLLGTTYIDENNREGGGVMTNTALNYLYNNMEFTRFNRLAEFIQLLSDISTKSPWYFQKISGLDGAVERQETGRDFKLSDERKQITIKCLADAYDNRIGRLLDLYRSVVWSQSLHKWILPANLRKFDMGIYIFNSPIKTISGGRYGISDTISERVLETSFKDYYGDADEDSGEWSEQNQAFLYDIPGTGSKYIELRGCEIDYNTSKSVYSELDNAEGTQMEYDLVINYDTAMEDRYDPIFRKMVGDFIIEDLYSGNETLLTESEDYKNEEYEMNHGNQADVGPYAGVRNLDDYSEGVLGDVFGAEKPRTIMGTAIGLGAGYANTLINKLLFGNIYGLSLSNLSAISNPVDALIRARRGINNASLIAKRLSDFLDPDKGRRKLEGKTFYRPEDFPDTDYSLDGRNIYSETGFGGENYSLEGKNLTEDREPSVADRVRQAARLASMMERNLSDEGFRPSVTEQNPSSLRTDTDHQDVDWSIEGKNMHNGWTVTPSGNGTPNPGTLRSPETDYQDVDWDLTGRNLYRP